MKRLLPLAVVLCSAGFLHAQSVDAAISKGNQYYRQQQYDLAETQYKKALEKDPESSTAQFNLASTLYRQKKYGEAHGLLKKFADVPDNDLKAKTAYNNGVIYTREKALERSIEAYKTALRLTPDDGDARENLQKALLEQKRQQQQKQEQQRQQKQSNMSQKEAEQKLKLLQEKEKRLQERLQRGGQKGNSMPKDW